MLLSQLREKCEISAGWGMMYGSCVQADADNTLLEYHPERRQETSPSRPGTSQLWYGHDMVITAACVHLMLLVFSHQDSCDAKNCADGEREKKNTNWQYIWWFQILGGKKKFSIYFWLCLVCVNGSSVLSNGEGGLGWESRLGRYLILSTIHQMSPFCQHHQQKFALERTGQQLLKTLLRQEFLF